MEQPPSQEETQFQAEPQTPQEESHHAEDDAQEVPHAPQIPPTTTAVRRSGRQRRPPDKLCLTTQQQSVDISGRRLSSIEQQVLASVYSKHGAEQFTKGKGSDVPDWLYAKALTEELANWRGHYEQCHISDIPPGAKVIGSHVVYRLKKTDAGDYKFKARLVVHGNEDIDKKSIRKDSATARLTTIRLILSMAVLFRLMLGKIDIKAAYFQSGSISRRIYVRPPREMLLFRTLWKLLSLPYGIAEAGRQWQLTSDEFLYSIGMEAVYALPQCFMLKHKGHLVLIVCKIVDDFLFAGTPQTLKWFST